MPPTRVRVMIVDDHPLVCVGLCAMFADTPMVDVVGTAEDAQAALQLAREQQPELALIDLRLGGPGGLDGADLTTQIHEVVPACIVLGLSAYDEPVQIAAALKAGASGFVHKSQSLADLIEAITSVRAGSRYLPPSVSATQIQTILTEGSPFARLTSRERQVLEATIEGESHAEIGKRLFMSTRTAEAHRLHIMRKVGVGSLIELIRAARFYGVTGA